MTDTYDAPTSTASDSTRTSVSLADRILIKRIEEIASKVIHSCVQGSLLGDYSRQYTQALEIVVLLANEIMQRCHLIHLMTTAGYIELSGTSNTIKQHSLPPFLHWTPSDYSWPTLIYN